MGNFKLIHIRGVMVCKHDIHIDESQKDMELFFNIKQKLLELCEQYPESVEYQKFKIRLKKCEVI